MRAQTSGKRSEPLFSEALVEAWADFVDCPKRLEAAKEFLLYSLSGKRRVLDAAMGFGCEAAFLALNGFDVIGNEIDANFRSQAQRHLNSTNAQVRVTSHDWCELAEYLEPNSVDGVVLLGNSFCHLLSRDDQFRAAENIRAICSVGAHVIIDQRNFDYILQEKAVILGGGFRYRGNTVYCGRRVRGFPVSISPQVVRFAYEFCETGISIGSLDMYPFTRSELPELFIKAGFRLAGEYSDLRLGHNEDADFFTYVLEAAE